MDTALYELLVARQNQMKTRLLKALTITLIIVIAAIVIVFFPTFLPVVIILGALAYFFVFPRFNVEYEYTILQQDFDIDIIYNKANRKSAKTIDLREAELIAPATSSRLGSFKPTNTLDYSTQNPADKPYAIIIPLDRNLTKVLIQPDEGMLKILRNVAPRVTFMD